jgi:hypothetical protein
MRCLLTEGVEGIERHPGVMAESQTPDRFALSDYGQKRTLLLRGGRSNKFTSQEKSSPSLGHPDKKHVSYGRLDCAL